jgi:transcriptional regulator with XRE-family HTH domain
MNTLGERVKARRQQLGLTQAALAEKVTAAGFEIGQTGISSIESRGESRPQALYELAAALDVTVQWLQSGEELPSLDEVHAPGEPATRKVENILMGRSIKAVMEIAGRKLPYWRRSPKAVSTPRDVPVLGIGSAHRIVMGLNIPEHAEATAFMMGWLNLSRIEGYRWRLPSIANRADVFCAYIHGYDLVPWRRSAELIYVDPRRIPHQGNHAFILLNDDGDIRRDERFAPLIIGRLVAVANDHFEVAIYNPERSFRLAKSEVSHIWTVIEWNDLLNDDGLIPF